MYVNDKRAWTENPGVFTMLTTKIAIHSYVKLSEHDVFLFFTKHLICINVTTGIYVICDPQD